MDGSDVKMEGSSLLTQSSLESFQAAMDNSVRRMTSTGYVHLINNSLRLHVMLHRAGRRTENSGTWSVLGITELSSKSRMTASTKIQV